MADLLLDIYIGAGSRRVVPTTPDREIAAAAPRHHKATLPRTSHQRRSSRSSRQMEATSLNQTPIGDI